MQGYLFQGYVFPLFPQVSINGHTSQRLSAPTCLFPYSQQAQSWRHSAKCSHPGHAFACLDGSSASHRHMSYTISKASSFVRGSFPSHLNIIALTPLSASLALMDRHYFLRLLFSSCLHRVDGFLPSLFFAPVQVRHAHMGYPESIGLVFRQVEAIFLVRL